MVINGGVLTHSSESGLSQERDDNILPTDLTNELLFILTYREPVARNAEVLQPSQPVHDARQVHQQTRENLETQTEAVRFFFFTANILSSQQERRRGLILIVAALTHQKTKP